MLIPTFKFNKLTRTDLLQFDGVDFINVPVYAVGKNVMWGPEGVGYNSLIVGDVTKSIPLVNHKHTTNDILGLQELINDLGANSNSGTSVDLSNYLLTYTFIDHLNNINSAKHVTQAHLDKLNNLNNYWQLDEQGNLYTTYNTYSTQELSAWKNGDYSGFTFSLGTATDIELSGLDTDDLLKYNGTKWVNVPMSSLVTGGTEYILPTATSTTLGGIKVGDGLTISSGVLSVVGGGGGGGDGSVTSVGLSVPTGLSVTGSPITSSGTLAISFASGYSIPTTTKQANWDSHIQTTGNPHGVTKSDVGLGNVNNTSDANKPVSTATQTALNLKLNKSIFDDLFEKVEVSTGVYAIKAKYNFYSVGGVSAYGLGSGGSGGGTDIPKLQSWVGYTSAMADYYVSASLLVLFRNDTLSRLTSLEAGGGGGSGVEISVTGSGNAITGVSKSGNTLTFDKGINFALASHTHTIAQVTGLEGALSGKSDTGHTHAYLPLAGGTLTGNLTAPTFIGALTGNSSTATTLATAKTIGISGGATGTATLFDGSSNITIPVTALDASKLTSGAIPDARLTGVYTGFTHRIDGANTIFTTPSTGTSSTLARTAFGVAEYRGTYTTVGAIVFIAPFNSTTMMKQMEIEGMLYSPSNVVKIIINNYSAGLTKQINLGSLDILVRIGQTADSKFCVILGDVNTSWSYPHFILSRVMLSNSSVSDDKCYGWSVKLETDLTGYLNVYDEIANSPIVTDITGNASTATTATTATTAAKLGTTTIGGTVKPIYLSGGTPTAFSTTVGSSTAPVYMNAGTITACGTSLGVSITGNANSATKLETSRTIWGKSFNGTGNVSGALSEATTITASTSVTAPTFIGALTGNAATATKLQTARTIWGQSFNGSADVSGALTGATTIEASTSVSAPKINFGNNWTLESSGTELVFKYNGVTKQRFLSDGTILATAELTAYKIGI